MFLKFQKITTSSRVNVIVNSDRIMLLEPDRIQVGNTFYDVTRVEVAGYSKMGFHTLSTFDQISPFIPIIDVTTTLFDPDACGSSSVYASTSYPLIKTNMVFNGSITVTEPVAFNPSHMISAEEVGFLDSITKIQRVGLLVTMLDAETRKLMTTMSLSALSQILSAQTVPHP